MGLNLPSMYLSQAISTGPELLQGACSARRGLSLRLMAFTVVGTT